MTTKRNGIAIEFDDLVVDDNTTWTEDGRHTGQPVPTDVSGTMGLRARRNARDPDKVNAWTDEDVVVVAQRGGLPAPASTPTRATYLWRYGDEAAAALRGWDGFTTPTGWQDITYPIGGDDWVQPCALSWGQGFMVAMVQDTSSNDSVVVREFGSDGVLDQTHTLRSKLPTADDAWPVLVDVNGTLCCYWQEVVDGLIEVRGARYDDAAGTWSDIAKTSLLEGTLSSSTVVSATGRMTAAAIGDVVLLIAERPPASSGDIRLDVFRSSDAGHSFEHVETATNSTHDLRAPSVVAIEGGFLVSFLTDTGGASDWEGLDDGYHVARVGLGESLTEAASRAVQLHDSFYPASGGLSYVKPGTSLMVDDTGVVYVMTIDNDDAYRLAVSQDQGATWTQLNSGGDIHPEDWKPHPYSTAYYADGSERIFYHRGRMGLVRSWNQGSSPQYAMITWFGGYATDAFPYWEWWDRAYPDEVLVGAYLYPILLSGTTWSTTTSSGNGGVSRSAYGVLWEASGPAYEWDSKGSRTLATSYDMAGDGFWIGGTVRVEGPAWGVGDDIIEYKVECDGRGFIVGISGDGIYLQHTDSGGGYTTTASNDGGSWSNGNFGRVEWRVGVSNGTARLAYRVDSVDRPGVWNEGGVVGLDDNGNSTYIIEERVHVSGLSTGTYRSVIREFVAYGNGGYTGRPLSDWIALDTGAKAGRPFSTIGTDVDEDRTIVATPGVVQIGDTWTVPIAHDRSIERALLDASPRRGWRSTDSTGTDLWLELPAAAWATDLLAIGMFATNVPAYEVYGANSAGGSTTLLHTGVLTPQLDADITAGTDLALDVDLGQLSRRGEWDGARLVPDITSATDTDRYGWVIAKHGAGTPSLAFQARVVQPPGLWAWGALPWGADSALVPAQHLAVVSMKGVRYTHLMIRIKTGTGYAEPVDGQYEIGRLFVGCLVPFPERTSWGRVVEVIANADRTRSRDGSTRAVVRGPTRRRVEVSWIDGVDTLNAWADADDPRAVEIHTTHEAGVFDRTTPAELEGLVRQLDGPGRQVVWVDALPETSGTDAAWVLRRRHEFLLGRLPDSVRFESVQGEETDGEVWRIPTITIEEDV